MESAAANTARSYALVGFIFYILGVLGWVIGISAMIFTAQFWAPELPTPMRFMFFPMIPMGIFGAATIGFAIWSWFTLQSIQNRRYEDARTASLVLGIIGIFLAWLIGGIFFLLAYSKLGEVIRPTMQPPPQRFCVNCGRAVSEGMKFCSHCGKEVPP